MKLPSIPLVVLDTETTGFVPRVNRVIEFASMRIEGGKVVDEFEQLIRIPDEIPAQVVALTHIHPEALADQPTMDEVRDAITRRIGDGALIVGQNVGFDLRMLKGEGIDLTDRPWIDTSMLASVVFPELESYSLGYMSRVLKLNHAPVHRALGDVRATMELLAHCWERLEQITPELEVPLRSIMQRAPEGYRQLFGALPKATATHQPMWLRMPPMAAAGTHNESREIPLPDRGQLQLVEEPLNRGFLGSIARSPSPVRRVLAVKNLHASLRTGELPADVTVIHPAYHLLDAAHAEALASQEQYTADEATIALKLAWYEPRTTEDAPIHGDERSVWGGKLACTDGSDGFTAQFTELGPLTVLNHRQLLEIAANTGHPGYALLAGDVHIIIDDASMLEDTATRAYGWFCALDDLRAAAEGDSALTGLTDLLQLWVEKTRAMHDVHYVTTKDVRTGDAIQLAKLVAQVEERTTVPHVRRMLGAIREWFKSGEEKGWITWIETRQNGSQFLEATPDRVSALLKEQLYDRFRVSLLVPPQSAEHLQEIVAREMPTSVIPGTVSSPVPLLYTPEIKPEDLVKHPLPGKTILLMGSRGRIEDVFVRFAEEAEQRGVTLICQGLSGGTGRMQAEFCAAEAPVVWAITPWSFETVELPPETAHHLVIESLPFDHPANPVFSKRAEHYADGFGLYSLPRLRHRLHRLLRTFNAFGTKESDVRFLDTRLEAKEYGRQTWKYLRAIAGDAENPPQGQQAEQPKIPTSKKDQLSMF